MTPGAAAGRDWCVALSYCWFDSLFCIFQIEFWSKLIFKPYSVTSAAKNIINSAQYIAYTTNLWLKNACIADVGRLYSKGKLSNQHFLLDNNYSDCRSFFRTWLPGPNSWIKILQFGNIILLFLCCLMKTMQLHNTVPTTSKFQITSDNDWALDLISSPLQKDCLTVHEYIFLACLVITYCIALTFTFCISFNYIRSKQVLQYNILST